MICSFLTATFAAPALLRAESRADPSVWSLFIFPHAQFAVVSATPFMVMLLLFLLFLMPKYCSALVDGEF